MTELQHVNTPGDLGIAFIAHLSFLQMVRWYKVFLSHTNNLHTVILFQVFLSNTNNYVISNNLIIFICLHTVI